MNDASFEVTVLPEDAQTFAALSGDWNPLHTDTTYAARSQYGRPILHGAFSAGLVSRMAGMHIPGADCLLHGMQLRFLRPIMLPAKLRVHGRLVYERDDAGKVEVTISDAAAGISLVSASYEFGRHRASGEPATQPPATGHGDVESVVVVTGARGAIGDAVRRHLGRGVIPVSSEQLGNDLPSEGATDRIDALLNGRRISAIVHCGWPSPDNSRLTRLSDVSSAVAHHVSDPLCQVIRLARLLLARGTPDALLLLIGSTAAEPGRHNFRSPLYSLSKSLLPMLSRILAVEMGGSGRRCATVVLDVVDGGMNKGMSAQARAAHEARSPAVSLPSADDIACQLRWMLENKSFLLSGATISLSGGALP